MAQDDDKLTITFNIYNGLATMQMIIPREKEEVYRKAIKNVNTLFEKCKQKYANTADIRQIAMIAVIFAIRNLELKENLSSQTKEIEDMFAQMGIGLNTEISE